MRKYFLAILISLSLNLSGCEIVRHLEKNDILIKEINNNYLTWKKIAVLPFTGDSAYRRSGAEWLSFLLKKHPQFEIIGPAAAEIRLREGGIKLSDSRIEEEEAINAGRYLAADAVIVGSARIKIRTWSRLVIGASLIDIKSKKIVVTAVNSERGSFNSDAEIKVKEAAQLTSREIIRILDEISGVKTIPDEEVPDKEDSFDVEI